MTQLAGFLRLGTFFLISFVLLSVALPVSADVITDCGPPANIENPLYSQALEAFGRLKASTATVARKRQLADRWSPLQTENRDLDVDGVPIDAMCETIKGATLATLSRFQSCRAQCNQAATSQSAFQTCQACAGPVTDELALREAESSNYFALIEPLNNRVRDFERHLKTFIFDVNAAIPKVTQKEVDRMVAILTDSPAIFVVADSNAQANPTPKHYLEYFEQVTKNADHISRASARHNVDPDLVRAIIWMESTRGYYDSVTGLLLKPKSILPMNVYGDYWTGFKVTREGLQDPAINIDTGSKILARIQAKTKGGSIAKTATVYGNLAAQRESVYGKTVEHYYNTKPWLKRQSN